MAARYATDTFVITIGTASMTILKGSQRDSAHAAVTGNPGAWSASAPVGGKDISQPLADYYNKSGHPSGPEQ